MNSDIHLKVYGCGIVMYSPSAVSSIVEGENFLETKYYLPEQVLRHVYEGSIVGFQTGDGFYLLRILPGYPSDAFLKSCPCKLRLGVKVSEGVLCIRDLSDLSEWSEHCPATQKLTLNDGYYHVTICSDGNFRRNEVEILIYLNPLPEMPALDYGNAIPALFA